MEKFIGLLIIFVTSIVTGCSGGNTSGATPTTYYKLPAAFVFANQTTIGGAVHKPLVLTGSITPFAGNTAGSVNSAGFLNYSGANARFNHPTDITTNGTSFYVADYLNNAIRQIDKNGSVTTLSCTDINGIPIGFNRPTGVTADRFNVYVTDSGSNTVRIIDIATKKVTVIGSTTGAAGSVDVVGAVGATADVTVARFNLPTGITTDGTYLYVADYGSHTIRMIEIATHAVYTLAGSSGLAGSADGIQAAARFNYPARLTTDGYNLYVTDFMNRTIRKIAITTGAVTTIAGQANTPPGRDDADAVIGINARFNQPNGITTDGANLYVSDSYNNTIRKISLTAPYAVAKIAGVTYVDAVGLTPLFNTPLGLTTDGTALYLIDSANNSIRKIN